MKHGLMDIVQAARTNPELLLPSELAHLDSTFPDLAREVRRAQTKAMFPEHDFDAEDPATLKILWQFDFIPRWMKYSGLPQALGGTGWAIYRALVEMDHQLMNVEARRHGKRGLGFAAPQEDIITQTGFGERAVRNHLRALESSGLVRIHTGQGCGEGGWGRWSHYWIEREPLTRLFKYAAPRLRPIHGGFAGYTHKDLPDGGVRIYGLNDHPLAEVISWETLFAMKADLATKPEAPDPEQVKVACGL